jgi:D-alanine-D-alanine ligase
MHPAAKIKVGVLRGGPSSEYDVSLKTGAAVLSGFAHEKNADKYHTQDILISKDGTWHISGTPIAPEDAIRRFDVLFNAMHGEFGEDGKIQAFLDHHMVPYTGSRTLGSAIGMNKVMAKEIFKKHGIKTPHYITIEWTDDFETKPSVLHERARHIFNSFPMPLVVKPAAAGSSVGVSIAKVFADIEPAIRNAFIIANKNGTGSNDTKKGVVLIEEYISGVEASLGVIEGLRGEALYALPAVEIRPKHEFFSYDAKYTDGGSEEIVPGNFTREQKKMMEDLARKVHEALGLRHYSRTDFIVSPRRGIYVLEVNTLPGITPTSILPKSLEAVGVQFPDFLDHIIGLALEDK